MCTRTRASVYYANIIFKRLSFPFILCAVRYHYEHSARDRPSGSPLLYIILLLWAHCAKITRPQCSVVGGRWWWWITGRRLSVFAAPLSRKRKLCRTAQVLDFELLLLLLLLLSLPLAFSHRLRLHISIVAVTLFTVHIIIVMCPTVQSPWSCDASYVSRPGLQSSCMVATDHISIHRVYFHYLFFSYRCLRV